MLHLQKLPELLELVGKRSRSRDGPIRKLFRTARVGFDPLRFSVRERVQVAGREEIFVIVVITVLFSVFTHGFTAWPAPSCYANHADKIAQERPACAEQAHVEEMRVRLPFREAS